MARKLDEVGRIVIPKEIRTYLDLREGSKLEIAINNIGEVILRRSGGNISDSAMKYGELLHKYIDMSVAFVADNVVEASFGEDVLGCKPSASVMNVIASGVTYFACIDDKTTIMPLFINMDSNIKSQIICPIRQDGECIGAILTYGVKPSVEIWEVKVVEFVAKIIGG